MQTKKKQPRTSSPDRSGDRAIHDLMSLSIAGQDNMRKDQAIDIGVKEHGSQHRNYFPHQNIAQASAYLMWRDFIDTGKCDPCTSIKLATGHFLVDKLPSKLKERMKLVQQLAGGAQII